MSSVWHMSGSCVCVCVCVGVVTKHLHNCEPLVSCARANAPTLPSRGQLEAACCVNCKTRNKRISISYPKNRTLSLSYLSHSSTHLTKSKAFTVRYVQHEVPLFPFSFPYFGFSGIDDNNRWINRRICRRCLFSRGFPFSISLSRFGVVSTRKFPIARAKILKFFMCVFYCALARHSLYL